MVDQREGLLGEAALAGRQGRIKESLARSPCHRHHAHERKALVADDVRIAHHDAGPHPMLFATDRGVEFHHDNCAAADLHSRPSTQPSPGTHRTGLPARLSTSASVSFPAKPRPHSSSPCSASAALTDWGFYRDRRSSARRRRSSSWRTASTTNLLRLFSRRSMSLTRSLGRVRVTRSTLTISYSQYDHTHACASPQPRQERHRRRNRRREPAAGNEEQTNFLPSLPLFIRNSAPARGESNSPNSVHPSLAINP